MAFSLQTINKLSEVLEGREFSSEHAAAQKTCFKKDSIELALEVGEISKQKIEGFECSINSPTLQDVELEKIDLGAIVDARVAAVQNEAFDELQTGASIDKEEEKVENVIVINTTIDDSIVKTIQSRIQDGAIPMLFAVFSRKNDYYGLGTQGTDTTEGGGRFGGVGRS
jgi:hypothetical protein